MEQALETNDVAEYHDILCDHCDMVVKIPHLGKEDKATCPRCDRKLKDCDPQSNKFALMYGICALLLFFIGCSFYIVDIRILGNINNVTIPAIPKILLLDKYLSLSLLFIAFVLLFPFLCLVSVVILCSGLPLPKRLKVLFLVIVTKLQSWCMPEIFLAGVLVSFVKLTSYGDIGIDLSFLPFCIFIILQIKTLSSFNPSIIWEEVAPTLQTDVPLRAGKTGRLQHIRLCRCCHAILPIGRVICPRCYERGYLRIRQSLQWTMALLLTAMLLYIPANMYAVMTTLFIGGVSNSTILDGVSYMWKDGDYPIAIIIFTASIIIPILKIIALFWLCYFSRYTPCGEEEDCLKMNKIYNIVEFIGRWSMIDIFVVAVTSTLIRHGEMISVFPDIGAVFFATVVIITMVASKKYDPRLIWDRMRCKESKKE